ncbi:NfeD family protein [Sporosarcina limicola]|uniref:Membrane-bound serine protease (ClpP class) n=1 Tax=Sporosarcina limicola TaxID=34101 RepID=A0A927RBT4_9BACL|nr:nodulation protein NfeD [Sporosarcina limicola]MBE1553710.1 membrane-bound serine protease (ClpP class) [Sporosarcina limicola]
MPKMIGRLLLIILFVSVAALPFAETETRASANKIYRVPMIDTIEKGLHAFLKRSFDEAENAGAEVIFLEINTPGGFIDAASDIAKLMDETSQKIKIIAYINDDALSAGAFLALHADKIYMSPRGRIGAAAAIVSSGNAAAEKATSAWIAAMKNAAESSGRKIIYAEAMANGETELPEYGLGKGELLTLTASEALKVRYSDGTVTSFKELLKETGYENAEVVSTTETISESIARFVTHPIVVPILLSVAGLGLVLELYSPGFGVPGSMGVTALVLFFYGHLVAGLAGYETIILFGIGVVLIIAEFFLPGGIAGVIGSLAIFGSIIMAGGNPMYMAISVLIAVAIVIIGMVIIMKFFGKKLHLLNKVVLMDTTDTESGYVSNVNRVELLGRMAKTSTPLRPSGAIELDKERIDVVSEGSYIDKGKSVMIVKVEGSRIVVRETEEKGEIES